MDAEEPVAPPLSQGVSLVLQADGSAGETVAAVRRALAVLNRAAVDHEILVAGEDADGEVGRAVQAESTSNPRVRWLEAGGTADTLRRAHSAARFPLVAAVNPALDAGCLDYLIPLAARYPVVCGYRAEGGEPLLSRLSGWCYHAVARALLGTRVRDCGSGLMMFRRSDLAHLLPESKDQLANAEVLARARQAGLTVAEAPVQLAAGVQASGWPRWRDLPGVVGRLVRLWWSRVVFAGRPATVPARSSWLPGLVLMVLAALLLFPELNEPLQDPDEGRQAEIPREMLAHGDLLTPRMLGEPYYEKPPLQYWLTAGSYLAFGVRPWAARLVPALAAWLTVMFTYLWGRRVLGPRPAFLGCLGLCLSMGFVILGRTVLLDSLLTCCVTASWFAAHQAVRGPGLRRRWWLMSALACGLGVLAKGPVAGVLLLVPVAAYTRLTAEAAQLRWRDWAWYGGLALAVAAPWYTIIGLADLESVNRFLWRANVLRFIEPFDHQQPWWYYVPMLLVGMLPWSLLWAWLGYFLCSRSRRLVVFRTPALGFCALTTGWSLMFFSLAGCKSPLYVAPAVPPLALLHGVCLDAILFRRVGRRDRFMESARQVLPRRATHVVLVLSVGCYVATGVLGWETPEIVILETGITVAALAGWWLVGKSASPRSAWAACAVATVAMVVVAARDLVTGFASRHSVAAIAGAARRWPGTSACPVVSYGRQWPSASFYLRRDLVPFFERENCQGLVEFLKQNREVLVLVESGEPLEELLKSLPANLDAQVRLPDRDGQAALVVVRRHDGNPLARQD